MDNIIIDDGPLQIINQLLHLSMVNIFTHMGNLSYEVTPSLQMGKGNKERDAQGSMACIRIFITFEDGI